MSIALEVKVRDLEARVKKAEELLAYLEYQLKQQLPAQTVNGSKTLKTRGN